MPKKPKSRPSSRNKSKIRQALSTPITSNPFLNFFLNKCGVKTNSKLHRFAKALGTEWTNMNYHEKSPYYQLADKAKKKRMKLVLKSEFKGLKRRKEIDLIEKGTRQQLKKDKSRGEDDLQHILVPKIEEPNENTASKELKEWLAASNLVEPRGEMEHAVLPLKAPSVDSIISVGSFHSMQNHCCSQIKMK